MLLGKAEGSTLDVDFAGLGIALRLGIQVTGLRTDERLVETATGQLPYDVLVIATGAEPVPLPGSEGVPGVHLLRTLDDAVPAAPGARPAARDRGRGGGLDRGGVRHGGARGGLRRDRRRGRGPAAGGRPAGRGRGPHGGLVRGLRRPAGDRRPGGRRGRERAGARRRHPAAGLGTERPWFAIGGIDASNLDQVLEAGARRIVVVRAITAADDPAAATAELAKRVRAA
ncbi:Thiamine-phosphate synthase [Streptomyces antimycoticus]